MSDPIDVEGLHAAREQAGRAKRQDAKAAKLRERRDSTATEDYDHTETEGTRKAHIRGNNLLRLSVAVSTVFLKNPQYFNSMSEADKTGFTELTFKQLNNDRQGKPFFSADQVHEYLETSHTSNGKAILQVNEEKRRLEQKLKLEQENNRRLLEALKSNQDFSKCQENQLKAKLNAAEIELARQSELQESHANQQQENDRLKLELSIVSEDAAKQILSLKDQLERHQENANKAKEDAKKLQWHRENRESVIKAKETAEEKHFLTAKGVWKLLQKDFEEMSIASIKKSLSEIMSQARQESPFLNVLE